MCASNKSWLDPSHALYTVDAQNIVSSGVVAVERRISSDFRKWEISLSLLEDLRTVLAVCLPKINISTAMEIERAVVVTQVEEHRGFDKICTKCILVPMIWNQ